MLAALVVGKNLLKEGGDTDTYEEKAGNDSTNAHAADAMEIELLTNVEDHISGEDQLIENKLDLSSADSRSLQELLVRAESSSRLCECEGRSDMTSRILNRCRDCDATSCEKCGGRPEHSYSPMDFTNTPRLAPSTFARELKSALPMSMWNSSSALIRSA